MANATPASVAALVNKKMGEDIMVLGSALLERAPVSWLSTGSLSLDVALGGGWVQDQWNEVVGLESSGKTATLLKTIAFHQQRDKKFLAAWGAAEDLDPVWCGFLGVDMDRVLVITTNAMEEMYSACLELIEQKAVDMIVIDSLPALSPMSEIEKSMDEFSPGRGAFLTGQFLRKANKSLRRLDSERPCACIIINQWRQKIGVTRGDPRTTPGGLAKNYFFWIRLELSRTEWIEKGKYKIGIRSKARTFKNKSAPNQRETELDFYFDDGGPVGPGNFDTLKEIVNVARAYEVITNRGRYYDFHGEQIADSRDALYAVIYERPELAEKISAAVMAVVRGEEPPQEPTTAPRRAVKRSKRS